MCINVNKISVIFDFLLLFKAYFMVSMKAFVIKNALRHNLIENSFYFDI